MSKVPKLVETAPEKIYLCVSDDRDDYDDEFPANEMDVTWCHHEATDCAVLYVRADIAAAPDLLAALEGALEQLEVADRMITRLLDGEHWSGINEYCDSIYKARDAIRKARGEEVEG